MPMSDDQSLLQYIAGGGRLSSPDNASARYRAELLRLMAVFVDSEMAGASGFADCINLAPGLKERMIAARIVLEKFTHAEQVLALMAAFGTHTTQYVAAHPWPARLDRSIDLGSRRVGGDMRLNVFHYPLQGWIDALMLNLLMGGATLIQLDELSRCSYQPLADTLREILPVEKRHAELGAAGVRVVLARGHDRTALQAAVNYWYPRVAATFGRAGSDHFEICRQYGLRRRSNEELLANWQTDFSATLTELDLQIPHTG
jgi:1,2-phenylacetyl-CoA epoxidase catalytic subunit